jgi:hypothetical protein
MIYEQRIYHAMASRVPDLLRRFERGPCRSRRVSASARPDSGPFWSCRSAGQG